MIVAGVDFGTLSVRVSIFDSVKGRLGSATAEYPLARKRDDPDYATQSHRDHMEALCASMRRALAAAGVDGGDLAALALDTTGSSVIPVGEGLRRWTIIISGATIGPKARPPRSLPPVAGRNWKRSSGAAACTRPSGDFRSCCTGCAAIPGSGRRW